MLKTKLLCAILLSVATLPSLAIDARYTENAPEIDARSHDRAWQLAQWQPMDQLILGAAPSAEDFSGRFKLLWDNAKLYLLVEITDDVLFDQTADPLEFYWDDDCLEIFIDEDASGGDHLFNFNAFAYHVALDNQVVDIGYQKKDGSPEAILLNNHIESLWQRSSEAPHMITWELAIDVYDDSFSYQKLGNSVQFSGKPVRLTSGKTLGFMLAYCDNDGSKQREHFVGSTPITPVNGDKNLGYKTANVFDRLILKK